MSQSTPANDIHDSASYCQTCQCEVYAPEVHYHSRKHISNRLWSEVAMTDQVPDPEWGDPKFFEWNPQLCKFWCRLCWKFSDEKHVKTGNHTSRLAWEERQQPQQMSTMSAIEAGSVAQPPPPPPPPPPIPPTTAGVASSAVASSPDATADNYAAKSGFQSGFQAGISRVAIHVQWTMIECGVRRRYRNKVTGQTVTRLPADVLFDEQF